MIMMKMAKKNENIFGFSAEIRWYKASSSIEENLLICSRNFEEGSVTTVLYKLFASVWDWTARSMNFEFPIINQINY